MTIRTVFFVFLLILVSGYSALAQSGRVQPTPTPTPKDDVVRVETEEIKLNVLAFDESGNFFRDVDEKDLVITENDVLHQPASVRRIPANVLIVMDTGGDLRVVKGLENTRRMATAVVSSLRDGDSMALVQYADKVDVVEEWTTDKAQLLAAIRRTNFGRLDSFVQAIKVSRDMLMKSGRDNKHLVLITDGTDSSARSSEKFDVLQSLRATDISVHVLSYTSMETADIEPRTKGMSNVPPRNALPQEVIDQLPNGVKTANTNPKIGPTISLDRALVRRMKARKADLQVSQEQLSRLADDTNGEFILPNSVDEMLQKAPLVATMIDASYVVTYMPKISVVHTRGIGERTIEVSSKRPGLIVQARRKLLVTEK